MNVYFISGLAADRQMFRNIRLPEGYTEEHIEWLTPLQKESLEHYAWRMGQSIDHTHPFIIVGFSLGGMLAAEIARQYLPAKTILISSIPCASHLPYYFRVLGKLKLHKLIPVSLIKAVALMKRTIMKEESHDKKVMRDAIRRSDPSFIRWSMDAVLAWKTRVPPRNYIHIHGSYDEILPIVFTKPTHIIKGAGHVMVLTRANELNRIINEVLEM